MRFYSKINDESLSNLKEGIIIDLIEKWKAVK
jgi:hypothetical protein